MYTVLFFLLFCRYLNSPWLCNLNWSAKQFRGKALKTKAARGKLLAELEDFYQRQAEEFGEEEEEGADQHGAEFVISSLESMMGSRPVHMPGYPESVPESDYPRIQFHAIFVAFHVSGGTVPCV